MLLIYIPALISLLNIESQQAAEVVVPSGGRFQSTVSAQRVLLHEQALKKLTEIGPKYSSEFKQIMTSNPSYSESLKNAIHSQQKKTNNSSPENGTSKAGASHHKDSALQSSSAESSNAPSIKLKVDFSNYK